MEFANETNGGVKSCSVEIKVTVTYTLCINTEEVYLTCEKDEMLIP